MSDWFFQECIEAEQESLLLAAIEFGEVGVEDRDCVDRTPLMVAIELRQATLARKLIALGANPNSKSNDGDTCLSRAIVADDLNLLELLLDAGADVELVGSNFNTPLALAAIRRNCSLIEVLLQRGANIEARGEMEETPLIEASSCGQAEAVTYLVKNGADRAAMDAFGQTAMMVAKGRGGPLVVAALCNPIQKKRIPPKLQPWFDARQRFKLTHAEVQMARELGMNPKHFGSLANTRQEPWKAPLREFIANCYCKRFGRDAPQDVRSLEEMIAAEQDRRARELAKKAQAPADHGASGDLGMRVGGNLS